MIVSTNSYAGSISHLTREIETHDNYSSECVYKNSTTYKYILILTCEWNLDFMQKIFLKCEIPQLIICHQMYFVLRTNRLQIGRNNYCNFVYFLRNCFQIFRETRNLSKKCESVNYPTTLSWLSAPRILCNATIYISDRDMDLIGGQSVTLQLNVLFRRGTVLPVSIHHGGFFPSGTLSPLPQLYKYSYVLLG